MDSAGKVADAGETLRRADAAGSPVEEAIAMVEQMLPPGCLPNPRWAALRLIEGDEAACATLFRHNGVAPAARQTLEDAARAARRRVEDGGIPSERLKETIAARIVSRAESIVAETMHCADDGYNRRDRQLDRVLTSRATGIPVMILLLGLILWITIAGANVPSEYLSRGLFWLGDQLGDLMHLLNAPQWMHGALVDGVYRVLAWVVSMMLQPMAIFFPLFTLLEDFGYLPRIAFNLDRFFQKSCACGKQALTMCMGFGCNAAGVVGCRIIDSPRERLIAILTNNYVPCNGRLPPPRILQKLRNSQGIANFKTKESMHAAWGEKL